jgi:hypothetical protein
MPRSIQGQTVIARQPVWPLRHNRESGSCPIMATVIIPLSLYRDIKITSETIDHKLPPPIARHKSTIENIVGPNLGGGVGGMGSKIGAGL